MRGRGAADGLSTGAPYKDAYLLFIPLPASGELIPQGEKTYTKKSGQVTADVQSGSIGGLVITKANAHLEAAELLYRQHHYRDAVSGPYDAAFSAMQALVGDPPQGRWEYPGLRGAAVAKLAERGLPIKTRREGRKRGRYLGDAREVADDREDEVEADTAIDALKIARETLRLAEECAPGSQHSLRP